MKSSHKSRSHNPRAISKFYASSLTFVLYFDVLDQRVRERESRDEWGQARKIVERAKKFFERMPMGKVRTRYLQELESRHCLYFSGERIPLEVKEAVRKAAKEAEEGVAGDYFAAGEAFWL